MAQQSTLNCLLWANLGPEFDSPRGTRLWEAFYASLKELQEAVGTSSDAAGQGTQEAVRRFLTSVLDQAEDQDVAARVRKDHQDERATRPSECFRAWLDRRVPEQLFPAGLIDRFAVSYYLAQLAYVFGQLGVADGHAAKADEYLRAAIHRTGASKPLAVRILEFLIASLATEIAYQAEGYEAVRDSAARPVTRRFYAALNEKAFDYLHQFAPAADEKVLKALTSFTSNGGNGSSPSDHSGRGRSESEEGLTEFARAYWYAVPTSIGVELELPAGPLWKLDALALAYLLSRKNLAGMYLFRYRKWKAAEGAFRTVLGAVDAFRQEGKPAPSALVPIEQEALLYQGRLETQRCQFAEAELAIDNAEIYFRAIGDEFAALKALKARAELEYRRNDSRKAERLLVELERKAAERGLEHDRAVADFFLGKLLSRVGFQREAIARFERANRRFRRYWGLREALECLFWQTAAEARRLELVTQPDGSPPGIPRENLVNARAFMLVYRRLFERVQQPPPEALEPEALWEQELEELREALPQERDPDVSESLLDLRLGLLPSPNLVTAIERFAGQGTGARRGWEGVAQAELSRLLLRLIHLQQGRPDRPPERTTPVAQEGAEPLRKFPVRSALLSALEELAQAGTVPLRAAAAHAQEALLLAEDLGLRGGLVPHLVDLSQYFVDRDCFIALLVTLHEAVDHVLLVTAPAPGPAQASPIDRGLLERAFCDLTRYLVLERNFYLGPPAFQGGRNPQLWARLEGLQLSWPAAYRRALLGGPRLSYPDRAQGLGWVESVGPAVATLQVLWVTDAGERLQASDFRRLEVPRDVVDLGHASSAAPLEEATGPAAFVLIGRTGPRPWVAHRIPDLDSERLFRVVATPPPWFEPDLEAWQNLVDRFTGHRPVEFQTPKISLEEIQDRYRDVVRRWFGNRFPPLLLEWIFDLPALTQPLPPEEQPTLESPELGRATEPSGTDASILPFGDRPGTLENRPSSAATIERVTEEILEPAA